MLPNSMMMLVQLNHRSHRMCSSSLDSCNAMQPRCASIERDSGIAMHPLGASIDDLEIHGNSDSRYVKYEDEKGGPLKQRPIQALRGPCTWNAAN